MSDIVRRAAAAAAVLLAVLWVSVGDGGAPGAPGRDAVAALRGILLDSADRVATPRASGVPFTVPATAPAYAIAAPRTEDLRALAERHAAGVLTAGLPARFSDDLLGFDTGDGWFSYRRDALGAPAWVAQESWTWTQAAYRADAVAHPQRWQEVPCPPGQPARTDGIVRFFGRLGLPVEVNPRVANCVGAAMSVRVYFSVGGLPLVGLSSGALVDRFGEVLSADGPLWRLVPLGEVALAPAGEIGNRLRDGPGRLAGDCFDACVVDTGGARLGLAYATTGGLGEGHDHIPGGVVDAAPSQFLLPALRIPLTDPGAYATHEGVLAISSALLVDDPAEADAARAADRTAAVETGAAARCLRAEQVSLCASQRTARAGAPVLLTAYGERYEPVGARGCDPVFSVDPGDGSEPRSFRSRSGTLITARLTHAYAEPGTYTVQVRSASRCAMPSLGGGTEPEYDVVARLPITVSS